VSPHDHIAAARHAAAREIIAGVAFWGGEAGLEELAADLTVQLAALIEQLAAMQGRSAVEVAEDLFS
jgi:ABC-type sugar transport system substrate-binding protein